MSYLMKLGAIPLFANAGVTSEMQQQGYYTTLCTSCVNKSTQEHEYIDVHMTKEQIHDLISAAQNLLEMEGK